MPGPWSWSGHNNSHTGPYLATWLPGQGRCIVMDFVRLGTRQAQPRFNVDGLLHKGLEFVVQEVTYRDDIESIDHPDAQFIAHARADVDALIAEVERLRAVESGSPLPEKKQP